MQPEQRRLGEPMRATLNWKSRCENPVLERVHGGQSVTFLNQLCKLFDCVFDLTRYFLSVNYEHRNRVLLGPELVVRIRKVANDLFFVGASGRPGPWIWPSEQRHVKAHSIGAIDDRSLFRKSGKSLLAVRALNEVSLQRSTPIAGAISAKTVPERGVKREKSSVRKTPSPATSQAHETARCGKAAFAVWETHMILGRLPGEAEREAGPRTPAPTSAGVEACSQGSAAR